MKIPSTAGVNFNLLRTFEAVARHGSFSRAGVALGKSQATVSAQIKDLELQIGAPLLVRTTRRVSLTISGEVLARSLTEGFQLLAAGIEAARGYGDERRRRVVMACVPSLSSVWLPLALAADRGRDKAIRIDIEELTTGEMIAALMDDAVDFGVGPCVDPPPAEISFAPVSEEPLYVLLPLDYDLHGQKVLPFQALASVPLITLSGSVLLQLRLEETAAANGMKLSSRTEVRQVQTAIGMARAGVGVAIVPRLALPKSLDPSIAVVTLTNPALTRQLGILTRRGSRLQSAASRLARHMRVALLRALNTPE